MPDNRPVTALEMIGVCMCGGEKSRWQYKQKDEYMVVISTSFPELFRST